jgi:hypothetical protein
VDNITLMRLLGLAFCIVVFVVTVLLMPRIFGTNPPIEISDLPGEGPLLKPGKAATGPAPDPATVAAARRLARG